ncbi:MAG: DUF3467 domain-containing protein [Candidatus Schekmanbacteria bacterium]|nr:DUF3467 domain-containing protein [Candidatus Schekmanbacteria bacterium]
MSKDKKDFLEVEINPQVEGGVYINQALIVHNMKEFIFDLGLALPEGKIRVQSRLITNPIDAKAIMLALRDNIAKYEEKFGEIKLPVQPAPHKGSSQVH